MAFPGTGNLLRTALLPCRVLHRTAPTRLTTATLVPSSMRTAQANEMLGGLVPPKQFRLAAATAAIQEEGGKLYQDLDGFYRYVEQLRALNHDVTITTLTGVEMQVNRMHWSCWSFAARAWTKPPSFSAFRAPASLCPETALALQVQQS